jgi:hypothetical protein
MKSLLALDPNKESKNWGVEIVGTRPLLKSGETNLHILTLTNVEHSMLTYQDGS